MRIQFGQPAVSFARPASFPDRSWAHAKFLCDLTIGALGVLCEKSDDHPAALIRVEVSFVPILTESERPWVVAVAVAAFMQLHVRGIARQFAVGVDDDPRRRLDEFPTYCQPPPPPWLALNRVNTEKRERIESVATVEPGLVAGSVTKDCDRLLETVLCDVLGERRNLRRAHRREERCGRMSAKKLVPGNGSACGGLGFWFSHGVTFGRPGWLRAVDRHADGAGLCGRRRLHFVADKVSQAPAAADQSSVAQFDDGGRAEHATSEERVNLALAATNHFANFSRGPNKVRDLVL
jgi:hypothetical protein